MRKDTPHRHSDPGLFTPVCSYVLDGVALFAPVSRILADLPLSLSPVQQRFVDALSAAVDRCAFERLPAGAVLVDRDGDDLKLGVKHPTDDGCDIRAFVNDERIIVFLGDAHEDFAEVQDGEDLPDDGDFVDRAVAWFLDALRGRIEFTATYRGSELLSTRYVRHADDGTQHGSSGFLTPAHLRLWQPKRSVRQRPSWT